MRWGLVELLPNSCQDTSDVLHDVVVPKTNHAIAISRQLDITQLVCFELIRMLTAIEFDHQLSRRTSKIGDTPTNGMLATEAPWHIALAQRTPEDPFDVGRVVPELARKMRSWP